MKDAEHDKHAQDGRANRLPELVEEYEAQREALKAAAEELERRRTAVRKVADLEAAEIIGNARRQIRDVILKTRRDLLVLTAQIQAVGCEPGGPSEALPDVSARALVHAPAAERTPDHPGAASTVKALAVSSRRQVHQLLLDARSELEALSAEAHQLRGEMASGRRPAELAALHALPAPAGDEGQEPGEGARAERADAGFARTLMDSTRARPLRLVAVVVVLGAAIAGVVWLRAVWTSRDGSAAGDRSSASSGTAAGPPRRAEGKAAGTATAPGPAPPQAAATTGAARPKPVSVAIQIRRPVWMRTTIDGTGDSGRMYAAGETRSITADREVIVRAGDAGAVLVSARGSAPTVLGRDGQPATRRFTAAGTVPPAPVNTAASTGNAPAPTANAPAATAPAASGAVTRPAPATTPAAPTATAAASNRPAESPAAAGTAVTPGGVPPPAAEETRPLRTPPALDAAVAGAPRAADVTASGAVQPATPAAGGITQPPGPAVAPPAVPSAAPASPPAVSTAEATPPSTATAVPGAVGGAPAAADPGAAVEAEILSKGRRWLEAYAKGDQAGMAAVSTESFTLEDGRGAADRFPAGTPSVVRTLEDVRIEGAGVGRVLSARMTERGTVDGAVRDTSALVTEVWVRRDDGWRLMGVRIAPVPRPR